GGCILFRLILRGLWASAGSDSRLDSSIALPWPCRWFKTPRCSLFSIIVGDTDGDGPGAIGKQCHGYLAHCCRSVDFGANIFDAKKLKLTDTIQGRECSGGAFN